MPEGDWNAGDVLADRYCLRRELGEGAAGVVWLARDARLDIDVAVKILRAGVAARGGAKERFASEGELSERMLSPNIVKVLARGIVGCGVPYIVYEHLDGQDLATRLSRGLLAFSELKMVVVHACRALARAHAVGVLHRDVKPENLFVTTDVDGRPLVKMLDFGVAELVARSEHGDQLVGTLEYIAPEVLLADRTPDARSDLYALGAVAYECCTGHVPFVGATLGELLLAHATKEVPPPSTQRPGVGPEIDAWFGKALAKERDERFSTAKEMAEALHAAVKANELRTSDIKMLTSSVRPRMPSFSFEESGRESVSDVYAIIHPREPKPGKPSS
ncbi:MAG: serine/threonine protein kinase [Labilithrix sp.]|nr:serine/threonine protein kinase [Labilithrix sp.]